MTTRSTGFVTLAIISLLIYCPDAKAQLIYSYDATLGTLPEAQGFTRAEFGTYPEPTVDGGILHQFPQSTPGSSQDWLINSESLDFATLPYFLEAELHVIASNFVSPIREGYYLQVYDSARRQFAVGISDDLVRLTTHGNFEPGDETVTAAFDPTDGFHTYRLAIDRGMGTLYVDGSEILQLPVDPSPRVEPEVTNRVLFGDATSLGVSETELRTCRFGVIPEPGGFALAVLGFAVSFLMRRRPQGR